MSKKLIGRIPPGARDEVRVELLVFHGQPIVNVRRWFTTADGKLVPTKKGLALGVKNLPALRHIIGKACKRARRAGLLPSEHTD